MTDVKMNKIQNISPPGDPEGQLMGEANPTAATGLGNLPN